MSADEVQHGRELAAQAIEDEARAHEAQFGIHGSDLLTSRAAAASGALWEAARIARGETTKMTNNERSPLAMNLSLETVDLSLEVLSQLGFTAEVPDCVAKLTRVAAAREDFLAYREFLVALGAPPAPVDVPTTPNGASCSPSAPLSS